MKCPHCSIHFHNNWQTLKFKRDQSDLCERKESSPSFYVLFYWGYRTAICPECKEIIIEVARLDQNSEPYKDNWRQIYPIGANRGPVPKEVPTDIAQDYIDACNVLPISAKASVPR